MTTENAFIDSNLLIYAHDIKSPYHQQVTQFIKGIIKTRSILLSPQVFLEVYRIMTQKIKKPITPKQAWQIIDYYRQHSRVKIVPQTTEMLPIIEKLSLKYNITGAHIFDVQIVATMLTNGINIIYTANEKDFSKFKEIETINPIS